MQMVVSEAYLQGLLEQIATQTGAPNANQFEYFESGFSLVEHRGNTMVPVGVPHGNHDHPSIL